MLKKVSPRTRQAQETRQVHQVHKVHHVEMHDNPAKNFFLYLTAFLSLAFIAIGEGSILFEFINKFVPDNIEKTFSMFDQGAIRFGIAAIIIAGPIFFFLFRVIDQRINIKKIPIESKVRKWVTYVVLFFAAATAIIDLIILITNLLEGDATTSFILKVLVVLIIAGTIFIYYFWDMYQKKTRTKKTVSNINMAVAYSVIVILLVTVISAFFIIDPPKISKQKRIDEQTVFNLQNIDVSVRGYFNQTGGKLPQSLDELNQTGFAPAMEKGAADITYKIRANNAYRLCASFLRSNKNDQDEIGEFQTDIWKHNAGDTCFDRTALKSDNANMKNK